jgi:CRISPR/Cas system-associated exonuclease Cas4 (RecB family)
MTNTDKIIESIYSTYEKENATSPSDVRLSRLGSSFIGNECLRQVFFKWRGFDVTKFSGRTLRIFETGDSQEKRILSNLKKAGFIVHDEELSGGQYPVQYSKTDSTGHFITKIDGVVEGIEGDSRPHLLEIKTLNQKNYNALVKHGVKKHKPVHYEQIQSSLYLFKLEIGLYIGVNKNTEEIFIEIIEPDPDFPKAFNQKIAHLVNATLVPVGISAKPDFYQCKWCDYSEVCFHEKDPLVHCRTCTNSRPIKDGEWQCALTNEILSIEDQLNGCSDHNPFLGD